MIKARVCDYLPLHVLSIDTIIFEAPFIFCAWSGPLPYASVTAESAIWTLLNNVNRPKYHSLPLNQSQDVGRLVYEVNLRYTEMRKQ